MTGTPSTASRVERALSGRYADVAAVHALVIVACIAAIWLFSYAFLDPIAIAILMILGLAAIAIWAIWSASTSRAIRAGQGRGMMAVWPIAPVFILITGAAIQAGLPLEVRFRSNQAAFESVAAQLIDAPWTMVTSPVGSFDIPYAEVDGGTVFFVTNSCVVGECGFVRGDPTLLCEDHRPIVAAWSTCSRS